MKLSDLPDSIWRQISKEELDLECEVMYFSVRLSLKKGKDIILNRWEYKAKEVKRNG